jgi:selenide,water dikinase
MGPEDLAHVLRPIQALLQAQASPDLLVGLAAADDASVYRMSDAQAVIATVDFFPPIVDDAYSFGAIAAANALSDVYAMGGEVLFALSLAGWPEQLEKEWLTEILRGGAEKVREAGGILAGGHTVTDHEPKYGLAVIGTVHPERIRTKGGARPGDVLLLTKPLGTGVVTTAAKRDAADEADVAAAVASMVQLNRAAGRAAQAAEAHALTDVTGFGLLGHAHEMAELSGARLRFRAADVPLLPGARRYAEGQFFAGGLGRNHDYVAPHTTFAERIDYFTRSLLFDPQTSGGLLAAVAPERADAFVAACTAGGAQAWVVGDVVPGTGLEVR